MKHLTHRKSSWFGDGGSIPAPASAYKFVHDFQMPGAVSPSGKGLSHPPYSFKIGDTIAGTPIGNGWISVLVKGKNENGEIVIMPDKVPAKDLQLLMLASASPLQANSQSRFVATR